MQVTFYKYSGERNVVDKSEELTPTNTVQTWSSVTLKEGTSVINPTLLLNFPQNSVPEDWGNYAYIEEFNRYYFIDNIITRTNRLIEVSMSVDVLYTYMSQIKANTAIIDTSASNTLVDRLLPINMPCRVKNQFEVLINYFPTAFSPTVDQKFAVVNVLGTGLSSDNVCVVYNYPNTKYFRQPSGDVTFTPLRRYLVKVNWSKDAPDNDPYHRLDGLLSEISADNTIASWILNIKIYPFETSAFLTYVPEDPYYDAQSSSLEGMSAFGCGLVNYSSSENSWLGIIVGDRTLNAKGIPCYSTFNRKIVDVFLNCTSFDDDYLEYPPYCKYYLYLPYYGKIEVDYYAIVGKYIHIQYLMDWDSGYCTIFVSAEDTNSSRDVNFNEIGHVNLLAQLNIQLGVDVPITLSNAAENDRKREALNAQYMTSALQSGVGAVAGTIGSMGLGVANPAMAPVAIAGVVGSAASGITGAISAGINYNAAASLLVDSATVQGNLASVAQYFGPTNIILYRIRKDYLAESLFQQYQGLDSLKEVQLSTCSGFTKVQNIHLRLDSQALSSEYSEVENLLKSGVIF